MTITHPGCDARWSGLKVEHCASCHLTFSETRAGDAHRVGEHGVTEGPNRRRCLTEDEMRAKRARNGAPFFVSKVNGHGTVVWSRYSTGEHYRTAEKRAA